LAVAPRCGRFAVRRPVGSAAAPALAPAPAPDAEDEQENDAAATARDGRDEPLALAQRGDDARGRWCAGGRWRRWTGDGGGDDLGRKDGADLHAELDARCGCSGGEERVERVADGARLGGRRGSELDVYDDRGR